MRDLGRRTLLFGLALIACPAGAQPPSVWGAGLPAGTYALDGQRSSLTARMRFLGLSRYDLRFTRVRGRLRDKGGSTPEVAIEVDPRAVARPNDLAARQAVAMLQPDRFPAVRFVGRELTIQGDAGTLEGDLTLHGVTRPARFAVRLRSIRTEPGGTARIAFTGSGQIQRSQFGMTSMRSVVGDRVELTFDVEFVREGPP
ncbi:YceI family protein [Phenylobacterium sp. J367]|uniref:YceI family protein n=1 Tax=Phenylobacterium sp. J367 TaxID=2898435 RepID=UPI0021510E9F|nr:YceI family protein [Phenylobacterium sp. J367]MCR5880269.1 YceI family protein [Phenylobacterium sp. J367]